MTTFKESILLGLAVSVPFGCWQESLHAATFMFVVSFFFNEALNDICESLK